LDLGPDVASTDPRREGMIAVANKPIPVVPDTGTEKAARLAADPQAAATARHLAAEAVTAAGLDAVVADVEQLVEELVANAAGHTQAPLELTIDARDDVVRVEVHDQPPRVVLGFQEHPAGPRGALAPGATDRPWSL
jgi:signal transduction histidine kinase